MFALPTPNRPANANSFFECGGVVLNWAALVAVILILLTFGTIAPSHACQDRNNPAPHATQATTKLIAKQSTVAASVAKPAIWGRLVLSWLYSGYDFCGLVRGSESHFEIGFSTSANVPVFDSIRQLVSTSPNHSLIKLSIEHAIAIFRDRAAFDRRQFTSRVSVLEPALDEICVLSLRES